MARRSAGHSATAIILLILNTASVLNVGYEKVYLLQNSLNNATSEIIATYVYKMGLLKSQYSLSAAVGLFNNVINLILLLVFNFISSKISEDPCSEKRKGGRNYHASNH